MAPKIILALAIPVLTGFLRPTAPNIMARIPKAYGRKGTKFKTTPIIPNTKPATASPLPGCFYISFILINL